MEHTDRIALDFAVSQLGWNGIVEVWLTGVAVIYNLRLLTQRFYRGHTDDIQSIVVHPSKTLVATGQTTQIGAYARPAAANVRGAFGL